jgi:serine palmitoyltransferase
MHLSLINTFFVYVSYVVLLFFGHLRDFMDNIMGYKLYPTPKGYAPLTNDFEAFYTRRMYSRIEDCWNRPISGVPGAWFDVLERKFVSEVWKRDQVLLGTKKKCLNLASYNYLGFASNEGPILEKVVKTVHKYGVSSVSSRMDLGTIPVHRESEKLVAEFVGKEDAMIFGMGYGTNSTTIPALVGRGDLILSDSLNHASLVYGCRASGARVKVFEHNNPVSLEKVVREAIVEGQPRMNRPWRRILILVEGIYSMEGEICRLPEIIAIKKKYKCYLYVDEAHSIGALGKRGRGVCDHWGVSPNDVDILMGTFTKSFASVGGYIAANKDVIAYLRARSFGQIYETAMTPGAMEQAYQSLLCIMGRDGTNMGQQKLDQLRDNSNFFREALRSAGLQVFGDPDSPVVPAMLYFPAKIPAFSREALKRGLAVVAVGFPATPLLEARIRFCLSAAHTRKDLEWAVKEITQIADDILIRYGSDKKKQLH